MGSAVIWRARVRVRRSPFTSVFFSFQKKYIFTIVHEDKYAVSVQNVVIEVVLMSGHVIHTQIVSPSRDTRYNSAQIQSSNTMRASASTRRSHMDRSCEF